MQDQNSAWRKLHQCWQGSQLVAPIYSETDMHSILQPSPSKRHNSQMSGWISCSFRRSSGITPNHKVILLLPQQHLCWDQITLPFCGGMMMGKGESKLLHSVWTIWCCNNYISSTSASRMKKEIARCLFIKICPPSWTQEHHHYYIKCNYIPMNHFVQVHHSDFHLQINWKYAEFPTTTSNFSFSTILVCRASIKGKLMKNVSTVFQFLSFFSALGEKKIINS